MVTMFSAMRVFPHGAVEACAFFFSNSKTDERPCQHLA
jgi:hypothetical protein